RDWSSDVCSSDLNVVIKGPEATAGSKPSLSIASGINTPKIGEIITVIHSDKPTTTAKANGCAEFMALAKKKAITNEAAPMINPVKTPVITSLLPFLSAALGFLFRILKVTANVCVATSPEASKISGWKKAKTATATKTSSNKVVM